MMENFRKNPPTQLGGSPVVLSKDFKLLEQTDAKGNKTKLQMPDTSNVLQYFTENGTKVSVRPSGTEPKIKFYLEVPEDLPSAADYKAACEKADVKATQVLKDLGV